MPESDFDSREVWNEYDWERFLQEQDRNTQKYFALLEQYMDHPERDEIIAREMGWERYTDEESDIEISIEYTNEEHPLELQEPELENFSYPPVYREAIHFQNIVNTWLEKHSHLKEHPEVIRLTTCATICAAKLAAALCGQDQSELGMTIAYLKRSLKAANDSLHAIACLSELKLITSRQKGFFHRQLFRVRDQVVQVIGDYRAEWRRRYGTM